MPFKEGQEYNRGGVHHNQIIAVIRLESVFVMISLFENIKVNVVSHIKVNKIHKLANLFYPFTSVILLQLK